MAKDKLEKQKRSSTSNDTSKQEKGEKPESAIFQDARFQHLVTDPRFKSLPKAQRKVKIDKRFQGMFTDDKFKVKYTVDKYGRKVNKSNAEDLKKFYELDSDATDSDAEQEEEKQRRKEEKAITADDKDDAAASSASELDEAAENDALESDGSGNDLAPTLKQRLLDPQIDYARGEGRLVTDSSSDEESTDDEDDPELQIDHVWGELDAKTEMTEESTRRLAVCNMDWDRIRATDLMVLFSSFLPPGGTVLSVKIFPSEFGKERLVEEEAHGPHELVGLGMAVKANKASKDSDDSDSEEELVQEQDSDAEEGDDYHMEKLRQYQLNRLRYYYAVVECDSVQTADKIYQECDGIEYESSATRIDLRFIPDDTSFDEDEPTDVCTELPASSSYKPRQFTTTALQQAKVDLTWDETAVERRELSDKLSSGKLSEVSDKDLRTIVAYSSEEDDADDEVEEKAADTIIGEKETVSKADPKTASGTEKSKKKKDDVINKYKALLAEINEKEKNEKKKNYEMEYTWKVEEPKEAKEDAEDKIVAKPKPELTPIEKVLQKRNEHNRKRKEERKIKKLQARGIDPATANVDSDSDGVPDGIDMNDPYFAEEFANGDFVAAPQTKQKKKGKTQKKSAEEDEEEQQKAQELQLLLDDDDAEEEGRQHFSLEQIQKTEQETKSKKKRRKQLKKSKASIAEERKVVEDNFKVNVGDDRFKAIYASHLFNIDPTDSHFKKTKGMDEIIHEKLKRRHGSGSETVESQPELEAAKRPRKQLENNLLVKSLKRKIQMKQQK